MVGSDGLFNHADIGAIEAIAIAGALDDLPARLIELVRLPSGDLHDDACAVAIRC